MKKIAIGLMISVTLFWIFYFVEKVEKKESVQEVLKVDTVLETLDEQNITFSEDNVTVIKDKDGYWLLVKVDNYQDPKVNRIYRYDEKGREVMNIYKYANNAMKEKKTLRKYTDDGKLKELNVIFSSYGEVYRDRKTIYNEQGNIEKEIIALEEDLLGEKNLYELEYHYNEEEQLLKVEVIGENERYISQENKYENGKLISKKYFNRDGDVSGFDYIYENEVLKEVRDFGEFWDNSKFYNEEGLLIEETVGYGSRIKYTYDEENRLIVKKRDAEEDYLFYNEDGEKIREDHYEKDSNGEFEKVSYTLLSVCGSK